MSRSWKKIGGYKECINGSKKRANKKYRKRSIELTNIPFKKYTNSWDIGTLRMLNLGIGISYGFEPIYKAYIK